jgi:hypothetical protein
VHWLCYLTPFRFGFVSARDGTRSVELGYPLAVVESVTPCRAGLFRWRSLRGRCAGGGELLLTPLAPRTWATRLGWARARLTTLE